MSKYQVLVNEYDDDKLPEGATYVQPKRVMLAAVVDDIATAQRLVLALTEK